MEITKEQLLAHIQELQCRYVKYFNKYMTNISYGGKPSFCCFENLQAVKNYIRILKQAYSEYHFECTGTPGENSQCCTICNLTGGQFEVTSVTTNGVTYNDPFTAPSFIASYINSIMAFNSSTLTWYPVLGDSAPSYEFDCESNVLKINTSPDEGFINIEFNCLGTEAKGYTSIEDNEGILQDVVFNFTVTKEFTKDCSPTGCCKLSSLVGNNFNATAVYIYFGVDPGYYVLGTDPEVPNEYNINFINETQFEVYINNVLSSTETYVYNPDTGYIETNGGENIGYFSFTCSFNKVILNFWEINPDTGDRILVVTYYFELTNPVNNTCSGSEVCKPIYSYCLQNSDIQNILDKSYAILSQYCNC